MYMLQFVYPSLEGWIFRLFFLAFMNDVAINIHVQVSVWTHILLLMEIHLSVNLLL